MALLARSAAAVALGSDERARCAVHEAGHVIVAMLVGYRVANAEILGVYRSGLQAQTQLDGRWREPAPWALLAVSLAGPLAEARHAGRDLLDVLNKGREDEASDLRRAQREAQRLVDLGLYKTADHALLVAEQHARRLLVMHWDFVMRAARQLYDKGRID